MSVAPALEFMHVSKRYGERWVLDQISCAVPRGQTTVFLGPSGTGKSTLLRLAIGLAAPDTGEVRALGTPLQSLRGAALLRLRQRFGMLFQDGALFSSLSAFDNVAFPLRHHRRASGAALSQRVDELLASVGLGGLGERMPDQLSGGQRKRVALARAIALEPDIVLFDEPTSGLDPQTSASIDALINDMQARLGLTFVVITHDVQSAEAIAHQVGMLVDGHLRAFAPRAQFFASGDPQVRAFLDRRPLAEHRAATSVASPPTLR